MYNEIQKLFFKAKEACPEASDETIRDAVFDYLLKATILPFSSKRSSNKTSDTPKVKSNKVTDINKFRRKKELGDSTPRSLDREHREIVSTIDKTKDNLHYSNIQNFKNNANRVTEITNLMAKHYPEHPLKNKIEKRTLRHLNKNDRSYDVIKELGHWNMPDGYKKIKENESS